MKFIKDDLREQRRMEKLLRKAEKHTHVAVDFKREDGFSMVDLAMVHEYGSKNGHIPERSFIRATCDAKAKEHLELIKSFNFQNHAENRSTFDVVFRVVLQEQLPAATPFFDSIAMENNL